MKAGLDDFFVRGGTIESLRECVDLSLLSDSGLIDASAPYAFPWTDLGNTERLLLAYGQDIAYCHLWKRFLVWDGARFLADETGEAPLVERAAKLVRALADRVNDITDKDQVAQDKMRKDLMAFARRCESKASLMAMIELAKKMPEISVTPDELDGDGWLLNAANGTIDLRSGALRAHDRLDLITRQVQIEFDPDAVCPTWDRFLIEIMGGDQEVVGFLRRAIGYTLTGDVSEHCLFFLYGLGQNGKGVLTRVLQMLCSDYGVAIDSDVLMHSKFTNAQGPTPEIAKLKGVRLASATETADNKSLDEAKLKQLTGGDRLTAAKKYCDPFDFDPTHKFWISGNHKPVIRGTDHGIWRRIMLVPFDVTFSDKPKAGEKRRDPTLEARLAGELPGILAWAVRGCGEWQDKGLKPPPAVLNAVSEYRQSMDILGEFIADATEKDPAGRISPREMYDAYRIWANGTGASGLTKNKLGRDLGDRSEFTKKAKIRGSDYYVGRKLKAAYVATKSEGPGEA